MTAAIEGTTTRPKLGRRIGRIDDLAASVASDLEADIAGEIVGLADAAMFSEATGGSRIVVGTLADGIVYQATTGLVDVDASAYFAADELDGRTGLIRFHVAAGDRIPSSVGFVAD